MPNTLFHNPYHFVPVPRTSERPATPGAVPRDRASWPEHLTHDRFVRETLVDGAAEEVYSGRIVCRLSVEELLAIGGRQSKGIEKRSPRIVELFTLHGKPAIPASSLRGMLSALAEAASNSTLRVLADDKLRVREYDRRAKVMRDMHTTTVHEWFLKTGAHPVPLRRGDKRPTLTLAEQLFGVVEESPLNPPKADDKKPILTLAGRIRPSHGLLAGEQPPQGSSPRTTKILTSPHPPSPALYLTALHPDGGFVPKRDATVHKARIQGRKFYVHRRTLADLDWQTAVNHSTAGPDETIHQKARVSPLGPCVFWFHLDFDNLSKLELELVCYVLHPTRAFRHKLGMGKPLGLGKVHIEPKGLFLVDRLARYRDDPLVGAYRYHRVWRSDSTGQWPAQYDRESTAPPTDPSAPSPPALGAAYRKRIATSYPALLDALSALELIGNPGSVLHPVHYPQIPNKDGADMEAEQFKWWVNNNAQDSGQFLRPLTPANTGNFTALPALDRATGATPAPPTPPPPPTDAELAGTVHEFTVTRLSDGNRARFVVDLGHKTVTGELNNPSDFQRLPAGTVVDGKVRLRIVRILYPLSKLALP